MIVKKILLVVLLALLPFSLNAEINLDKCFQEVQSSNMSKLGIDGKPIYNESGKVMKDLYILNLI